MSPPLSGLYPILDERYLPSEPGAREAFLERTVLDLCTAGINIVQLREKSASREQIDEDAATLRRIVPPDLRLILNDDPGHALAAAFDGAHLGQRDLPVGDARKLLGPNAILGISTHSAEQVRVANDTSADYLAIGPIFATASKADAEPVVGLDGLRKARALTTKPLVAIGGITLANARSVWDAGADSVAVIGALFAFPPESGAGAGRIARDFLELFRYNNL